jgi:hypothetical protein
MLIWLAGVYIKAQSFKNEGEGNEADNENA